MTEIEFPTWLTPIRLFLSVILLLPFYGYRRQRRKDESFGEWMNRAEQNQTTALRTRLQRSIWITPGSYLRLLFWAAYISYPIYWLLALSSFFGLFQADLDRGLATFLSVSLKLTVAIACIWYFALCGLRERPPELDVRLVLLGWPQVLLYSLILLNIYHATT